MILVTGGTGLVGSYLLFDLVKSNANIRAIYRNQEKLDDVKKIFSYYSESANLLFNKIDWVKSDLLDITTLSEVFNGVTHVYHCAAFISFDPKDYHRLRKVNIEGTANIVNLCISNNIAKLCHVSSISTLGNTDDGSLINEETYWNPEAYNSVYGITKYGAEMEVWRGTQEGLNTIIVNPGLILGAGFWDSGSGLLFKEISQGLPYYVTGTSGYIDVKDVVKCMILLMNSHITNERFVLVSENLSFKYFADLASHYLGVKPPTMAVTQFMLKIGWRFDWLKSFFAGKPRRLTKQTASTALTITNYSNQKIKNVLDFNFLKIEDSIKSISQQFLNEN